MADYIRPTPRNPFLGGLADLLEASTSPERTQQMQGIMSMLGVPAVASTLNRMSYGAPLTSGAGGLGGTTRVLPDVLDAALAVAPMAPAAGKAAGKAAVATGRAIGPTAAGMTERYMQRQGLILPLDVYHGTPHTLPSTARNLLGEFDASKIGTGEGAQVYGRGIYTAEAPAVAKGYQNRLGANLITVDGKPMDFNNPIHIAASIISDPNNAGLPGKQLASAIRYDPKGIVPFGAESKVEEIAKALESGNLPKFSNQKGNLYKADLPDAMILKMLDWDKPLSQQPEIMKALTPEAMGLKLRVAESGYMGYVSPDGVPIGLQVKGATPENFRKKWLDRIAEFGEAEGGAGRVIGYLGGTSETSAAQVSEALRQAGIPGIKYLDELSRAEGKGTRNFVTFPGEEQNLRILERNGLLGTIAP